MSETTTTTMSSTTTTNTTTSSSTTGPIPVIRGPRGENLVQMSPSNNGRYRIVGANNLTPYPILPPTQSELDNPHFRDWEDYRSRVDFPVRPGMVEQEYCLCGEEMATRWEMTGKEHCWFDTITRLEKAMALIKPHTENPDVAEAMKELSLLWHLNEKTQYRLFLADRNGTRENLAFNDAWSELETEMGAQHRSEQRQAQHERKRSSDPHYLCTHD
jgi:hypothetical protein